jgi:hypothetical protein
MVVGNDERSAMHRLLAAARTIDPGDCQPLRAELLLASTWWDVCPPRWLVGASRMELKCIRRCQSGLGRREIAPIASA